MTSRRSTTTLMSSGARGSQSGSKSGIYGVSSKRNVAFDSKLDKVPVKKATVQVFDESGEDVTPRSLLTSDLVAASNTGKNASKTVLNFNDSSSVGTPSELFNQSVFGASTLQASYAAGFSRSIMSSMMGSSRASLDSVADEIAEPSHAHNFAGLQGIERKRIEVKENLTPADLKKMVTITLEETETIWHFDMPGICINNDKEQIENTKLRNKNYEQLCANRAGNDMYIHRGMQTFNDAPKTKEMQTEPVGTKEVSCMATNWDMYDTFNQPLSKVEEDAVDEDLFSPANISKQANKKVAASDKINRSMTSKSVSSRSNQSNLTESNASFISTTSATAEVDPVESDVSSVTVLDMSAELAKIMKMDSMKENAFIMERTVIQNLYHSRQAAYRGNEQLLFSSLASNEEEKTTDDAAPKIGPNMSRLWSYECPATKGLSVTCMVWNKKNHDLLGVGYAENGCTADGKGLVCVWSIKNPEHPERTYTLNSAVVSIDFSNSHPNFLAVGLYNGTIIVFNIRYTKDSPVLDSIDSVGKHAAPVWQLRWVERDKGTGEEKGEVLISSSADGRMTQWSIRKGFEYLDLMKLKRVSTSANTGSSVSKKSTNATSKKSDALISRYAAGLCFDFHPEDGNIYLSGTEEGRIHKCSCSYNEQFLETYNGHKGAVYRMFWSPFDNDVFLSCSADWTVRLWHVDKTSPALSLQASTKAIVDVDWSPMSPVMFASINEEQMEIWDLSVSTLDPLLVNLPVTKVNLTAVKFALNSEALMVGDCEGHVTIYQLREMNLYVGKENAECLSRVIDSSFSRSVEVSNEDDVTEGVDR